MFLIHKSTGGALEIVGVEGVIEPGVPFEVHDDDAPALLVQSDLYAEVTEDGTEVNPAPEPEPETPAPAKRATRGGKK